MKLSIIILLFFIALFQGCKNEYSKHPFQDLNQFSTSNDTLLIKTEKTKGRGLFTFGASALKFIDTVEGYNHPLVFPKNILGIKRAMMAIDTNNHWIDIISGTREEEKVFIVDQNNNQDLTDDSAQVFKEIDWISSEKSIPCKYSITNGQETLKDSSWIKIGTFQGYILCGIDEYLNASLSLDDFNYEIGIIDRLSPGFIYGFNPEIALLSQNSSAKDTLLQKDIIKRGEYLKLHNSYYRFDSISTIGDYLVLIKEDNFINKIGTQVGMIAPEFKCVSTSGDTIDSHSLRNRPIVIANSCGCGGDIESTEAFDNIRNKYGDMIYALRLDSKIKEAKIGWHVDMNDQYNRSIYEKYRNAYCSRMSYIIGTNGRILDKFKVTDWKLFLPNHFLSPIDKTNN